MLLPLWAIALLSCRVCVLVVAESRSAPTDNHAVVYLAYGILMFLFLALLCRVQHYAGLQKARGIELSDMTIASSAGDDVRGTLLIKTVLPEFRSMTRGREVNNLWYLHSWVRLILRDNHFLRFYSRLSDSHMVVYSLLHVVSAMLVTTILYAITEPSDDFCYERRFESDCLADHTVFTRMINRCHWSSSEGCSFRRLEDSITDIIFSALVVCGCCVLLMSILEYSIMLVFSSVLKPASDAPVLGINKKQPPKIWSESRLNQIWRFVRSCCSSGYFSSSDTEAALRDFESLNKGILKLKNGINNEVVRNQFCAAWGVSSMISAVGMPLPEPQLDAAHRDDLSVDQLYANCIYLDLVYAHREAGVLTNEINDTIISLALESRLLDMYFDARTIQTLTRDLLPWAEGAILKATIDRRIPPLVHVHSRLIPPLVFTALLAYVVAAGSIILLYAGSAAHRLQLYWLLTLLFWFVIDACLLQPMILVIQGYLVPAVIKAKLYKAQDIITKNLICLDQDNCARMYDEVLDEMPNLLHLGEESNGELPENCLGLMFFASARVAMQKRPNSSRSMDLVKKFGAPYPRYLTPYVDSDEVPFVDNFIEACRTLVVNLLAYFEGLPLIITEPLLRIILLGMIWLVYYGHLNLYNSDVSAGVWAPSGLFFFVLLLYALYVLFGSIKLRADKVAPQEAGTKMASEDLEDQVVEPVSIPVVVDSDEVRRAESVTVHRDTLHIPAIPSLNSFAHSEDYGKIPDIDTNSDISYSIVPSFSEVSLTIKDDLDDADDLYGHEEFYDEDSDKKSYTVRLSMSSHSSRSSISINIQDNEIVNRRNMSITEVSKADEVGISMADMVEEFTERKYNAMSDDYSADFICDLSVKQEELNADENALFVEEDRYSFDSDDNKTYSIVTNATSYTDFTLYEETFEEADDKSYSIDVSDKRSSKSSFSLFVGGEEDVDKHEEVIEKQIQKQALSERAVLHIAVEEENAAFQVRREQTLHKQAMLAVQSKQLMVPPIVDDETTAFPVRREQMAQKRALLSTQSKLIMSSPTVEVETTAFPVRRYTNAQDAAKYAEKRQIDVISESRRISVAPFSQTLRVSNEDTMEIIEINDTDDDGSVFSTKPRVKFQLHDVQEEAGASLKKYAKRLPAVTHLSPKRVENKPEPLPQKKAKPLHKIYGSKKKKQRKKKDILRERLNAKLAKEEEIRGMRERQEVTLHPHHRPVSPGKSPGKEYENESFELIRSTPSMRVASPRTQKKAGIGQVRNEDSVFSVDTEPGVDAIQSEMSAFGHFADENPKILETITEPWEELTPISPTDTVIEVSAEQAVRPRDSSGAQSKVSFFRKLWSKGTATRRDDETVNTKTETTKMKSQTPSRSMDKPKNRFGAKVTWNAIRSKFRRSNKVKDTAKDSVSADERNEEKDAGFVEERSPVKLSYQAEFSTPARARNSGPTQKAKGAGKAHTDPVKKSYNKIYQSRISWNRIKKHLLSGKEPKSPRKIDFRPIEASTDDSNVGHTRHQQRRLNKVSPGKAESPTERKWKPVGKNSYGGHGTSWQNLKTRISSIGKKGKLINSPKR